MSEGSVGFTKLGTMDWIIRLASRAPSNSQAPATGALALLVAKAICS